MTFTCKRIRYGSVRPEPTEALLYYIDAPARTFDGGRSYATTAVGKVEGYSDLTYLEVYFETPFTVQELAREISQTTFGVKVEVT